MPSEMISALLVDDEINNLENLQYILENDCTDINVVGKVQSAQEARNWLKQHTADVVFLDIQMPNEDGFSFLNSITEKNFQVIFITAYNQFALQAIKSNALDYLLKPLNIDELHKAIQKLKHTLQHAENVVLNKTLLDNLLQTVQNNSIIKKIALPQLGGIVFIELEEIVSLQADSNYSIIHLQNMQKKVISKTLKDFEELLDTNQFVRIHKSYIVNLRFVKEYSTTDGGIVKMTDGNHWSISRRQLENFLEKMKNKSLMFGK